LFQPPLASGLLAWARIDRRMCELVAGNWNCVTCVWRRIVAPHVFSDEGGGADPHVVAAFMASHDGRGR